MVTYCVEIPKDSGVTKGGERPPPGKINECKNRDYT